MIHHSRVFLMMVALLTLPGCEKVKQTLTKKSAAKEVILHSDQITSIDASSYGKFTAQKDRIVIVDFYADWCAPCQLMSPVLEKAAVNHPDVVFIGKVNVDQANALAASLQVSSIPELRIFKNGQQVDQIIGFPGEDEILKKIATHAAGIAPVATVPPPEKAEGSIQPMQKDWMPPGIQKR